MSRSFVGALLCGLFIATLPGPATAQQTSGVIRGKVAAATGEPVDAAEVIATNVETGVRTTTASNTAGNYVFPTVPTGRYDIEARRIGFRGQVQRDLVVRLGETVVVSFALEVAATELEALTVTAVQPLIDPDQTGVVDLVTAEQVEAIPVAGRNFSDLVALSPKVGVDIGDGTGGALSLGGGRRGANLIQIDGAGTTGTFFGGEARGSDRIPFAFSIESVKEFQVVSNGFDVEYGFFSGGVINAITKSGTNEFHGSLFGYLRDDAITRDDFFGREITFTSKQVGGTFSGPLVRDKLHFYVAVERQDRNEPVFGLPAPGSAPDPAARVHPDSVARFLQILSDVYGVEDRAGTVDQTQDEWTVFGRLDWQINNSHRLTLRHNYTDLNSEGDRVSSDETFLNGGVFKNTGNSTVAQLTSILSPTVWNEARAQLAFEPRPREANTLLPEGEVFVTSDFPDGSTGFLGGLECCNDPVLPNNLEETTFEFINNLHVRAGQHELKIGGHFNYFDYVNFFFFQQQGRFRFGSLADFEAQRPFRFERALPNPGPDNLFFTDDDILPLAEYQTYEIGLYLQDTWQVNDRFSLTGGVRYDITQIPDAAPLNEQYLADLGLRTDEVPEDNNVSPRISFTYDPAGTGTSVVRGGVGLFFGRFPSVLYSNSLLNTGGNQLNLRCDGADVPFPDYQSYAADPTTIPTGCVGGGAASPPIPNINSFAANFEYPRTWKASAGYDQALPKNVKLSFDFLFSSTNQNFYVVDRNLLPEQFRNPVENRPVFAPIDEINPGSGEPGFGDNRRSSNFNDGLLHVSTAEARTYQFSVGLEQRRDWYSWQAGYTYTNSRDNASYSCCISGTAQFETPTAGNPNFIGDRGDEDVGTWGRADFNREHTFVVSGILDLPADIQVSGIWRTFSGRPWTPIVDGNVNGDRDGSNDRVYVPDPATDQALFVDPDTDIPLLQQFLDEHSCLRESVGRIVHRNACRNDFFTQLDLRLRKRFRFAGSQAFEITADFFNVLNLLDSDWSRNVGVTQFGDERALLNLEGFDPATRTHLYSVNPSFAEDQDLTTARTDQGSMQIGVKYLF